MRQFSINSSGTLCLAENTSQASRVEFVPLQGTNSARSRLQKPFEKPRREFSKVRDTAGITAGGVLL